MKRFLIGLTATILFSFGSAFAQFIDIKSYDARHPQYITKDAIKRTSNLRLSSDGTYFKIQLSVRDQSLQKRFQRDGITFYIDPSGKKSKDIALLFPGARPLRTPPHHESPDQEYDRGENPLDMQHAGAILICSDDTIALPAQSVDVSTDDCGFLTYTAIISCEHITKSVPNNKKWQIGIFAEKPAMPFGMDPNKPMGDRPMPNNDGLERPEMPQGHPGGIGDGPGGMGGGPGGMGGGPGMRPGGPHGGQFGASQSQTVANDKIENWIKVSYTEIIN